MASMSWSDALASLPILGARRALEHAQRKLEEQRSEIVGLREELQRARTRTDIEKAKRRALERRTWLRRTRREARPAAPAPVDLFAGGDAQYAFANVISYPKSGRTWFSTLYFHYARFYFNETDLQAKSLYTPDQNRAFQEMLVRRAAGRVFPVCTFTHLGSSVLKPFEQRTAPWPDRTDDTLTHPTVLIVRDPRDVVVSHYHHLRAIDGSLEPDMTLAEFIRGPWGIRRVLRFMDMWAEHVRTGHPRLAVCTFEELRRDAGAAFAAAMTFMGASMDHEALARAVEESTFERLREKEHSKRVEQGVSLDRDAFRFRQGTIGAHAHELSDSDRDYLETIVSRHLHPAFSSYQRAPVS
jgi:hypothetical protein